MRLKFVYMGHGYDQTANWPEFLELPETATVDIALRALEQELSRTRAVAGSCLVVVSGRHLGTIARHENIALAATDELMSSRR